MQETQDSPSSWFEGTLGTWWERTENSKIHRKNWVLELLRFAVQV
jgi:hypothetical protein